MTLILRASFPTKGLETGLSIKVNSNTTVSEFVNIALNDLRLKLDDSKKELLRVYLFKMYTKDGVEVGSTMKIADCDFKAMDTVIIRPEGRLNEEFSQKILAPRLQNTDTESVHSSFTKAGYLTKRKTSKRFDLPKKRWVVLKDRTMVYFSSPTEKSALGTIDLTRASYEFHFDNPKLSNAFDMAIGSSTWQFVAENEVEARAWHQAISGNSNDKPPQADSKSLVSGFVMYKNSRKWISFNSQRVSIHNSIAETREIAFVNVSSSKVVFDTPSLEVKFSDFDGILKFNVGSSKELEEWKKHVRAIFGIIHEKNDEFKHIDLKADVIKSGWLDKKKCERTFSSKKRRFFVLKKQSLFYLPCSPQEGGTPLGMFDLPHTQVSLTSQNTIELATPGSSYVLSVSLGETEPLQAWFEQIRTQCSSTPFNFVHKQHVDFDYNWSGQNPNEIFALSEKLGTGAYATVYTANHIESDFILAIKIMTLGRHREAIVKALKQEIDVLKRCRSPHIVSYFGTCSIDDQLWILMDHCACGSVKDVMKKTLETLDEEQLSFICSETLKGLIYLHGLKIIHHDIKAGNLLLTEKGEVKLADFGVAQQYNADSAQASDYIGSPLYMSPEVLKKATYSNNTDVWSLGITVIEMSEGNPPNADVKSFDELLQRLLVLAPPTFHTPHSNVITSFVSRCLTVDTNSRPSAKELVMDPFVLKSFQNPNQQNPLMPLIKQCSKI